MGFFLPVPPADFRTTNTFCGYLTEKGTEQRGSTERSARLDQTQHVSFTGEPQRGHGSPRMVSQTPNGGEGPAGCAG